MERSVRRLDWRAVLLGVLSMLMAPTLASAQNTFPATGNVGIGTASPAFSLDVAGYIRSSGGSGFILGDGSNANYSILYRTGNKTYLWDNVKSQQFTVDNATGNLGIGATDPAFRLDVDGPIRARGGNGFIAGDGSNANYSILYRTGNKTYLWDNVRSQQFTVDNATGNVGIGTTSPASKLHVAGDVQVDGNLAAKYQDVAEWVTTAVPVPPGVVVIVDPQTRNQVLPASGPYDTRVAGVVSVRPGLLLGEAGDNKVKVAHSGRVKVKVDASYGAIGVGDLLVTSPTPGHAMRSMPFDLGGTPIHRPGTLLGKALEPLEAGQGEILVLLTLQ
jgi:hypothetical protein